MRTIAKVPLRRGEVDTEFDQEMLAELLDQLPFNLAVADLYKTRFNGVPGVVYSAGVRHAYNVAAAFRDVGMKAQAVSGETPKRELAEILARYERGDIDVLVNAQLLAEGWNSPRATVCMHLAPTASKRIYQQRVGRVTRRHPGKEAGIVVDFVHPATKHDDPVVTLHSLLDREVYRGGAIVVGPVRRGRGRRLRVERRVLPVTADENRRIEVFERELWRIAVEHLDYGEQVQWAALAGARVAPAGWRRARAMLHFDQGGELKRTFLITAVDRNKNAALRLRALQEIAASRDAEAFDRALDFVESWPRDDKREGVKVVLQALAEKKIGRRDQANNWIWRCANMTREVHEEYAVQRWPETKRLLGLLVNSSGGAHARNARRLVHASRQQDRRLSAALLAAAIPHTAEAGEVVNGARTRMSRKPAALARELLRNFPKGKGRRGTRRRKKKGLAEGMAPEAALALDGTLLDDGLVDGDPDGVEVDDDGDEAAPARKGRSRRRKPAAVDEAAAEAEEQAAPKPAPRRTRRKPVVPAGPPSPLLAAAAAVEAAATGADAPKPAPRRRSVIIAEEDQPKRAAAAARPRPRRSGPRVASGRRSRWTSRPSRPSRRRRRRSRPRGSVRRSSPRRRSRPPASARRSRRTARRSRRRRRSRPRRAGEEAGGEEGRAGRATRRPEKPARPPRGRRPPRSRRRRSRLQEGRGRGRAEARREAGRAAAAARAGRRRPSRSRRPSSRSPRAASRPRKRPDARRRAARTPGRAWFEARPRERGAG